MKSMTERETHTEEREACIHQKGHNRWKGRVFVCSLFDVADKTAPAVQSFYALILGQLNIIIEFLETRLSWANTVHTKLISRSPFPLLSALVSYSISLSLDDVQ